MSDTPIRVVPGPANYYSHPGALARLGELYTPAQLSRAVWVYGERAIAAARPFLPEVFDAPGAVRILFRGIAASATSARWRHRQATIAPW